MSQNGIAAAILKHNRRCEEYDVKRRRFNELRDEIENLIGPADKGAEKILAGLADIETHLENVEYLFDDLGHLPPYDEHGVDDFRIKKIERRIADGHIATLNQVAEEYRAHFAFMFDTDLPQPDFYERPRASEDIREDIAHEHARVAEIFLSSNGFSEYMPAGQTKVTKRVKEVRALYDNIWDDYEDMVSELIHHF